MNGVASQHQTTSRSNNKSPASSTPPASVPSVPAPNAPSRPNGTNSNHTHAPATSGNHTSHTQHGRGKKKADTPIDPVQMYESLKNRIAALEEEEVLEEEEERHFAEEAQKSVKGLEENAIHAKYIELFAEFKRLERDHAREKQKLLKDKDNAKGQLTKANQTKTKMENLARELQKDNKRLREDGKRLAQCVEDAQEELMQMKNDISKRVDKAKQQEIKYRESPDIVVKVICRYRADLFFKISRKTKLSRLFNAWTDRMESSSRVANSPAGVNGKPDGNANSSVPSMEFVFTHNGRAIDAELTPEEAGMEDNDEILAVELMDLTEGAELDELDDMVKPKRQKLRKEWTDDPEQYVTQKIQKLWSDMNPRAKNTIEDIFDGVVRERLKEVLRQYELRERHFECVIRSKELEVLLSRARAAEQKQLAENEKIRSEKQEEENRRLTKDLEELQLGQTKLIDKLIACCKEPNAERTQRLFASLREELEKRGSNRLVDNTTVNR